MTIRNLRYPFVDFAKYFTPDGQKQYLVVEAEACIGSASGDFNPMSTFSLLLADHTRGDIF